MVASNFCKGKKKGEEGEKLLVWGRFFKVITHKNESMKWIYLL